MTDQRATTAAHDTELLVRDGHGTMVPLDEVRRAFASLAVGDPGARAANEAGRLHPSQVERARASDWGGEVLAAVTAAVAVLTGGCLAVAAAVDDQPELVGAALAGTIGLVVPLLGVAAVTRRRRIARRLAAPVVTLRDRLGPGPGPAGFGHPPVLAGRRLAVHPRWVGLPVVAHVLDAPRPLVLSIALDEDALTTVSRAQMTGAARAQPVRPVLELAGRGRRRYEVVDGDGAEGATLTVHRPGRPSAVISSAGLTGVEHELDNGDGWWRLRTADACEPIRGRDGEQIARALLRRRPDLGVVETRSGH